ncbi:MAG TPA: hypothetical protein VKA84_12615, partial [Gemmatimonadaceae bacterium]|nr:hypothetical protein [Gemmatimonadaceae bacterium]
AVGMTFEEASSGGGAIRRSDGTVLTLRDAAWHHYTAAWATLLTTARRASERVRDYAEFRRSAVTDGARTVPRAVVFERDEQDRADSLAALLRRNGIDVGFVRGGTRLADAAEHGGARAGVATVPAQPTGPTRPDAVGGGYVVDFAQPQGRLARALLEPDAVLDSAFIAEENERRRTAQASRFYDITAWSLPYAYRLRAWSVRGAPPPSVGTAPRSEPARIRTDSARVMTAAPEVLPRARHAYAFASGSEAAIRTVAALLSDSVRVWYAPRSFVSGGVSFPRGAFVVRVAGNDSSVHDRIRRHAAANALLVVSLASALVEQGTDLGSNSVYPVRAPRVALVGGAPIQGTSFGFAWFALERRIGIPVTTVDASTLAGPVLDEFNVLIVPSVAAAAFERTLGDAGRDRIAQWVRGGGVLITIDAATGWLASERLGLSRLRARRDSARADSSGGAPLPADVPGAIVRVVGDTLSPLMAGVHDREFAAMANSDRAYTVPRDLRAGEAVVRYAPRDRLRLAGYLWPESPARLADSPYLWTERVGRGRVIAFAGEPNFRDLWRGLLPLFANSVLLGASF